MDISTFAFNPSNIKALAFDLDGTLTQHKSPLSGDNLAMMTALSERFPMFMAGAGACMRIFRQMGEFPIDIFGNYGLEYMRYDKAACELREVYKRVVPADHASVDARVLDIRERFGYETYAGLPVEYHASGMITIPLIGTAAALPDKLAFDPDRSRRRKIYPYVRDLFPEYTVFVGGSSSFDLAPMPYHKLYAVDSYCAEHGITRNEILYFGDDWEPGGNDHDIFESEVPFCTIYDYRKFAQIAGDLFGITLTSASNG